MPTIEWNKEVWGKNYFWKKDGDEWNDQAKYCNQPYNLWKRELIKKFIDKNINKNTTVLEIAPGHARWTEHILRKTKNLILVDLNRSCIDYCKKKFSKIKSIRYIVNEGDSLKGIKSNSVDFIWSFDSFVHIDAKDIEKYIKEFQRVLKNGGFAIIHHANRTNFFLRFNFLTKFGFFGNWLYRVISLRKFSEGTGKRSNVSNKLIRKFAKKNSLIVDYQIDSWGKKNQYTVKLFRDTITRFSKK